MIKKLFFLYFGFQAIYAQEKTPHLNGNVKISITEGTFECDFTLSDIPNLKDYYIRINSGMNILNFKSLQPNEFLIGYSFSPDDKAYESRGYYFPANNRKDKFLPKAVQVKYVGKFPVIKDTINDYSRKDWKGNIAFNSFSVRADGTQSAWYPILYDITNDKIYDQMTYDVTIECVDCNTLYVNGNIPVKTSKNRFVSDTPKELMLFCGNYDYKQINTTYILNPDIGIDKLKELEAFTGTFKKYYEKKLSIPFGQPITFIQTTPTSKKDGWLFVTYPTIVNVGYGNNSLSGLLDKWFKPFIAHELGHYYFGTHKVFNSELGDMLSEGFAEYLSLKLSLDLLGKDVYQKEINEKFEFLSDFKAIPFQKIKTTADYVDRQTYVYDYAPIVFLAIEKEIGEKQMWQWIRTLLQSKTEMTNYDFMIKTLDSVLKDKTKLENIISKYFDSDDSVENAIKKLKS